MIFIYVVTTGNEGDKKARMKKISINEESWYWIAFGENFSLKSLFLVIYILGCRRCLVAPDTRHPQTMDGLFVKLFGCVVG